MRKEGQKVCIKILNLSKRTRFLLRKNFFKIMPQTTNNQNSLFFSPFFAIGLVDDWVQAHRGTIRSLFAYTREREAEMDQVVADLEDRGQRSINVKTEDFMNE
jgi:hypothetical protein